MKACYPEGWILEKTENKKGIYSASRLEAACDSGEVLESVAYMCDNEHNLLVNLGSMKGIIPRSEGALGIKEGTTRDIALISRVGKAVCFTVKEIINDGGREYAVLSRFEAQKKARDIIFSECRVGDIIDARVTHLESFGAFCDIGSGNIALLPIDSISVSRISHPRDRFAVGDDIKVIIRQIENGRITLSHKELLGTWEENAAAFSQGQTVYGVVRSVESYGVFVELAPNLAGLAELRDTAQVGQSASVYIKSIIPEKMKIKLIIIDTFDGEVPKDINYFYEGERIEEFTYSPKCANKKIHTVFE
jgi:small subunit ribosomal protein S1